MISDKYDTKPGRVKTSQPTNTTYGGDGMLTSMLSQAAQCQTFILLLQMKDDHQKYCTSHLTGVSYTCQPVTVTEQTLKLQE